PPASDRTDRDAPRRALPPLACAPRSGTVLLRAAPPADAPTAQAVALRAADVPVATSVRPRTHSLRTRRSIRPLRARAEGAREPDRGQWPARAERACPADIGSRGSAKRIGGVPTLP